MGYYNVEHPDYYTRDTEICRECEEEFLADDGAEFFYKSPGKTLNFCCETCMCNSFVFHFNDAFFCYESLEDMIFDNGFEFSHRDIFDAEWEAYKERVKNEML